jgi:hypothetical protein
VKLFTVGPAPMPQPVVLPVELIEHIESQKSLDKQELSEEIFTPKPQSVFFPDQLMETGDLQKSVNNSAPSRNGQSLPVKKTKSKVAEYSTDEQKSKKKSRTTPKNAVDAKPKPAAKTVAKMVVSTKIAKSAKKPKSTSK